MPAEGGQIEKNRKIPRAITVTPDPMRIRRAGFARGNMIGTAPTTLPRKAMNNEMSRGRFDFFASAMVSSIPPPEPDRSHDMSGSRDLGTDP